MPPQPSFDTWTIIFLIAAVQGYFIAFVLAVWRRGNRIANRLLALLMLLFALTLTEYVLYWTNYISWYPHMAHLSTHFPFLFGPIIWLYLRTIYDNKPLGQQDLLHLVPFALALAVFAPWYGLDAGNKRAILINSQGFPVPVWLLRPVMWLRIIHLMAYGIWNIRFIRRQPRVGATTRWALLLNGFFLGFTVAYASYFILVRFAFFNSAWDYQISAAMTAFIYLIAYAGYAQPSVFEGYSWMEPAAVAKYRNSGLTSEASRTLLRQLVQIMENEKLYRDPELSLDVLSGRLGASKHHVSQVINEHLGGSFFDYVNHLRIAEAKRLLAETRRRDLHVIEAAYKVGFNNKVSFNTAFKKATGMTPTEFRKSHSHQTDTAETEPGGAG